ncbi:hypothetical protein C0J52_14538 [Blattella germanica]|nr:hypothetical protein C0J52_14538 [Blattella germanica]
MKRVCSIVMLTLCCWMVAVAQESPNIKDEEIVLLNKNEENQHPNIVQLELESTSPENNLGSITSVPVTTRDFGRTTTTTTDINHSLSTNSLSSIAKDLELSTLTPVNLKDLEITNSHLITKNSETTSVSTISALPSNAVIAKGVESITPSVVSKDLKEIVLTTTTTEIFTEQPNEDFRCTIPGKFPSATNCRVYHICKWKGLWFIHIKVTCHLGLVFHPKMKFCVPKYLYNCEEGGSNIPNVDAQNNYQPHYHLHKHLDHINHNEDKNSSVDSTSNETNEQTKIKDKNWKRPVKDKVDSVIFQYDNTDKRSEFDLNQFHKKHHHQYHNNTNSYNTKDKNNDVGNTDDSSTEENDDSSIQDDSSVENDDKHTAENGKKGYEQKKKGRYESLVM